MGDVCHIRDYALSRSGHEHGADCIHQIFLFRTQGIDFRKDWRLWRRYQDTFRRVKNEPTLTLTGGLRTR